MVGCGPETHWLRVRCTKPTGEARDGVTTAQPDRIKALERESQPLCYADEDLKQTRFQQILHCRGPDTMQCGCSCERRWTGAVSRPITSLGWRACVGAKAVSLRDAAGRPEWMPVGDEVQPTVGHGFYRCLDLARLYFFIYFVAT